MAATAAASDAVFGHYMQQGNTLSPAPAQSSALFESIISDNINAIEEALEIDTSRLNGFCIMLHWPAEASEQDSPDKNADSPAISNASVIVKQRTWLMLAAYHGSLRVLSSLLSKGAEPFRKSPDGLTAYDFAVAGGSQNASTVLAMLKDAEGNFNLPSNSSPFDPVVSAPQILRSNMQGPVGNVGTVSGTPYQLTLDIPLGVQAVNDYATDLFSAEGLPYSTAELTRPEYSTDTFRMFCFKVLRCSKRYAHDWRACPFAHPTENARRRDPRELKYCSAACPDYKQGFCIRGDTCPYAHGVFESWLHPSRYRTQLCKDGLNCRRPVCFFAHALPELRTATYTWMPESPDSALKPVKTGSFGSEHSDFQSAQSDSPLDAVSSGFQSNSSQKSLLDMANASVSAELMSRLKTSSPDPSSSTHLLNKMIGLDTSSLGSSSILGSPIVPGSPTSSAMGMSAGALPPVAAPRMSNAFARKHGLNPRDNPAVNLQKIALSGQIVSTIASYDPHGPGQAFKSHRPRKHVQQHQHHQHQHHQHQHQHQQYYQQPYRQQAFMQPQEYMQPDPSQMSMFGAQLTAGHIPPAWQ